MQEITTAPILGKEVRLGVIRIEPGYALEQVCDALLSTPERRRADRFVRAEDRARFVIGRGVLRCVLAGALDQPPGRLAFGVSAAGKPVLAWPRVKPALHFNVAHTDAVVAVAASWGRRVGVDVERERVLPDRDDLVDRFFSDAERAAYARLPDADRTRAFFATWTRKEAFAKAVGVGIAETLHRFSVTVDPDALPVLHDAPTDGVWAASPGDPWRLLDLDVPAGYAAALAVEGRDWHLGRFDRGF